jgi:hypothetical protein
MPSDGYRGSQSNKTGLKINNQASTVPHVQKPTQADFDEKANEAFHKYEDMKKRGWELAFKFRDQVLDKTLHINKGPIVENLENEVIDQLYKLSIDMNDDDNRPEGEGSSTMCALLMRCMLKQRDIINELAFKIDKLEKLNIKEPKV